MKRLMTMATFRQRARGSVLAKLALAMADPRFAGLPSEDQERLQEAVLDAVRGKYDRRAPRRRRDG